MSAHASANEKAEHTFKAIGTYSYRPNIISDVDFEPPEITLDDNMADENMEGTKDEYSRY
jgi:hypothetical protein